MGQRGSGDRGQEGKARAGRGGKGPTTLPAGRQVWAAWRTMAAQRGSGGWQQALRGRPGTRRTLMAGRQARRRHHCPHPAAGMVSHWPTFAAAGSFADATLLAYHQSIEGW